MQGSTLPPVVPPQSFAALAEQLRAGPLRQLRHLQTQLAELTDHVAAGPPTRIEDLERLVRLSVAAMGHFNAFTRELASVLRRLTDGDRAFH